MVVEIEFRVYEDHPVIRKKFILRITMTMI